MSTNEVEQTETNAIPADIPAANSYDYIAPSLDEQFNQSTKDSTTDYTATTLDEQFSQSTKDAIPVYKAQLERVKTSDIPSLQEQESHSLGYTSYDSNPHLMTVHQIEDIDMKRSEKNGRSYFSFYNGMDKLEAVIFTLNGQQQIKIGNYILPLAMFLTYAHAQGDWRGSTPNQDLRSSSSNNYVDISYSDGTSIRLDMCTVEMLVRAVCEISFELTPAYEKPRGIIRRLIDALF